VPGAEHSLFEALMKMRGQKILLKNDIMTEKHLLAEFTLVYLMNISCVPLVIPLDLTGFSA
jgi:hypothetical protein